MDSGLLELLALVVSNLSILHGTLNHLLVVCKASEKIHWGREMTKMSPSPP